MENAMHSEQCKIMHTIIILLFVCCILSASFVSAQEQQTRPKIGLALGGGDDLFNNDPPRKDIEFRRKQEDLSYLSKISVGIKDGKVALPKALTSGQKIGVFFQALMLPVAGITDFDKLQIPYRAVAADLETGEMVAIGTGNLADAARASMSVSGVFPPVEVNGRYLTDGGIVRNLPVDVVRKMCSDIVIA